MSLLEVLVLLYAADVLGMAAARFIFMFHYTICKSGLIQLKETPYFFEEEKGLARILDIINALFNPLDNYQGLAGLLRFDEAVNEWVMWEVEHGYILGEEELLETSDKEFHEKSLENVEKKVVDFKKVYKRKVNEELKSMDTNEEIDYLLHNLENAYLRKAANLGILDDQGFKDELNDKTSIEKRVKCLQKAIKKSK